MHLIPPLEIVPAANVAYKTLSNAPERADSHAIQGSGMFLGRLPLLSCRTASLGESSAYLDYFILFRFNTSKLTSFGRATESVVGILNASGLAPRILTIKVYVSNLA